MSDPIETQKAAFRQQLRQACRSLSLGERHSASAQARARLQQRPEWQRAHSILFYAPLDDELDLLPLVEAALVRGCVVTLPRFAPAASAYEPAVVHDLARDLTRGRYGIREPADHCAVWPLKQLDLTLAPGVGFDLNGRRLGRGQGYYDRLLAEAGGLRCGVAMDRQVVPAIPVAPHDVGVDCILTPTRWLSFHRRAV